MTSLKLSCDNFHGKLSAGLLSMLETEQLVNVTIAVDGRFLKAHKMVLSICSSYFKTLLETNPCKHPIIFMKDVKYHIMKHLLRFMYEGATEIDAEDFPIFIDTAQALQIKWLTTDENTEQQNTKRTNLCQPTALPPEPPPPLLVPIIANSMKRPFKPETEATISEPPQTKPDLLMEDPLLQVLSTNFPEQIATKRPKILTENENIDKASASFDDLHVQPENERENVVDESETKEQLPRPVAISNAGCTSGIENRFFEHPLDDDSSYQDDMPVKEEGEEIIDIDDDDDGNEEGDEMLEQLPDMAPGVLPDTSISMQVSTLQEGEPVAVTFYKWSKSPSLCISVKEHFYTKHIRTTFSERYRCLRFPNGGIGRTCKATVTLTHDNGIVINDTHDHEHLPLVDKELRHTRIFYLTTKERVLSNNMKYRRNFNASKYF